VKSAPARAVKSAPARAVNAALAVVGVTLAAAVAGRTASIPQQPSPPPQDLRATGHGTAEKREFTPRHPLWTDGAAKRRWIALPPGESIDTSNPDAWEFPRGTRLWKEFAFGGPVETRFIERQRDGSWRYLTYIWNREGTEATLAPEEGAVIDWPAAPGGKYVVPSRADCVACHEGPAVPVLGYSAVQLGATIAGRTPEESAALGYLHGNCGHCHNANSLGGVGLSFAQSAADPMGSAERTRTSIGAAEATDILRRLRSTNPYVRMPPVGVRVPDAHGADAVARWLDEWGPRLRGGDTAADIRSRGDDISLGPRLRGGDNTKEKPQ
jgi:hypothetical protein